MRGFILSSLLFCLLPVAQAAEVQSVRLWDGPDHTRVVFDLNGSVDHTVFTLENPHRIVIDIDNAQMVGNTVPTGDGLVKRIRYAPRHKNDLRVVFDLTTRAEPKTFLLPPHDRYGYRLVVDVENPRLPDVPVKQIPHGNKRDLIIAIDAGHGGEDPGAVGSRGTYEKNITLEVAHKLAALIKAAPGMTPMLVRKGDYYISLRGRMEIARKNRADMFISIHADAFRNPNAHGSSVYILSERGASSEAARWLAKQENAADLVGGVRLDDKNDMLRSVLLDLSQTATIAASMRAANKVLSEIDDIARLHKDDVQQAAFVVLKSPDIPSMLVETAFITNPAEERKLLTQDYQQRLAQAMLAGVRAYFHTNPVPGTLIAARVKNGGSKHIISPGDTLSGIARQYHVSISALRSFNQLESDMLKVGDVLQIPVANIET